MKKIIIIIVVFLGFDNQLKAQQNLLVNQYMYAGVIINPAFTGTHSFQEFASMYRKQWVGIQNSPLSTYAVLHGPWKGSYRNIGTGISIQRDQIGSNTQTEISGLYSYKLRLPVGKLSFGLRTGLMLSRTDLAEEIVFDTNDPVFQQNISNDPFFNVGAGIYYYSDKVFFGVATQRLKMFNLSQSGFSGLENNQLNSRLATVYGGYVFKASESIQLKPSVLVKLDVDTYVGADINMNALYKDYFWFGMSYKVQQGYAFLLQFEKFRPFRIGYAYDINTNAAVSGTLSSHEVILSFDFGERRKVVTDVKLF